MKKFLFMVLVGFVLFALVACGGNGNTADTPDTQAPTTQNETPSSGDATSGHATEFPDSYYTIGDVINFWDYWELVFHEGARVVPHIPENLSRYDDRDDGIRERAQEIAEAGILLIPATITRTGAPDQAGRRDGVAWFYQSYSVFGPNGEVMDRHSIGSPDQSILWELTRDFSQEEAPTTEPYVFAELLPGESHRGYIFAIYDGDGDYIIQIRSGQRAMFIVITVSI